MKKCSLTSSIAYGPACNLNYELRSPRQATVHIIKSMVIINPENFGFENNEINLMDNLKSTFENNLNDSIKEFELLNANSLRIIIAKSDKATITDSKNEAELLLDLITNELKIN